MCSPSHFVQEMVAFKRSNKLQIKMLSCNYYQLYDKILICVSFEDVVCAKWNKHIHKIYTCMYTYYIYISRDSNMFLKI